MTDQQKETILIRIKKLMALTESRGATPEEAATAAAKAQALLFEHNLTMAAVESHEGTEKGETIGKHIYDTAHIEKQYRGWRSTLLNVVARYNFCFVVGGIDGKKSQFAIIGKKSNVEIVIFIFEHVQRELHKMALAFWRKQTENKGMQYNSFANGAVLTIRDRLKEQQEASMRTTTQSNALVVVNDQQLAKMTQQFFPRLKKGSGLVSRRPDAFAHGRAAGHSISLNRGIGSSASGAVRQIGGK